MAKKHYKIIFELETPYPITYTYREEAGGIRAALSRATARLRKDTFGKPLTEVKITCTLKKNWPDLTGVQDATPTDQDLSDGNDDEIDELDEEDDVKAKKTKKAPITKVKKEEPEEEEDDEEPEEEDEQEEEMIENDNDIEDEEPEEDDEALDYESLIVEIRQAKDQKRVDELVAKYITPFEWTATEVKTFDVEIAKVKDSWDEEPKKKPSPKVKKGSTFENVMAMAGKNK